MGRFRSYAAATALGAAAVLLTLSAVSNLSSKTILDQTEIGENEKAYPYHEQEWVEDAYKQSQEFRDPGHISREEIRLEAALRNAGLIDRGKDWSFQQPLWGKYHQVMSDPSHIRTGWTGGRRIDKHSDPVQHAIEQYGYGSEGHREPEEEWAPESEEDPLNLSDEKREKMDRRARGTWEHPLSEDKGYLFLQKQVADLHQDIRRLLLKGQQGGAKSDDNIRQQLTYRVLKDELVHARLKQQVAEAAETKAEESENAKIKEAKREEDTMLDDMHEEVARLRHKLHRMKSKRTAEERRKHMSAAEAAKDLSDYFSKLDTTTTEKEMARYQAKLSKLRSMVSAAKAAPSHHQQQLAQQHPNSQAAHAAHKARAELAPAQAERTKRGGAKQQQLASVGAERSKGGDSLKELIKTLAPNKSPFLPV